jgi:RNA polymerase sigma-70 factor (ECF subfamily)
VRANHSPPVETSTRVPAVTVNHRTGSEPPTSGDPAATGNPSLATGVTSRPPFDGLIRVPGDARSRPRPDPSIVPHSSRRRDVPSGLHPLVGGKGDPVLATLREHPVRELSPASGGANTGKWNDLAILVRRAQRGDREAFGRLVEQFERTVYAVCLRRLGNPSEALELTQEVFLHVMKRVDQLREPERFAGWLRQVAARMAINRATRRLPPPSVETDVLEGAGAGDVRNDPLDELIARERAQRLYEGLGRLKTLDRETLVAFYIQGQSLLEMADRLDTPIGTIKRRLHTARKRLKAELEGSVSDASEWSDGEDEDNDFDLEESDSPFEVCV